MNETSKYNQSADKSNPKELISEVENEVYSNELNKIVNNGLNTKYPIFI